MEELGRCIAAAMDPHTPPDVRDAANRHLYSFQTDPNSMSVCLEALVRPDLVEPTMLSFLMNVAKVQVAMFHERWDPSVRTEMRNAVVRCYTLPLFSANARTSEKMALILVEFAAREWPQLWPEAFDVVYGWLDRETALGLLFLTHFIAVLRSESGEGHAGGWIGERKSEVTAAFNEIIPGLCRWLHAQQVGNPKVHPLAIRVYGQLASWAKCEGHERLVEWCLDLLDSAYQEEAIEALCELPNRSFHAASEEDCGLVEYILGKGLRRFNVLLETFVGSNYLLFRQLMDIITGLLCKLCNSGGQGEQIQQKICVAVLDLQLYLSHPSLYVRTVLVMCILDVFKANTSHSPLLDEAVEQAMPLVVAILAEDPHKTYKTADNQNDFDEFAEYQRTFEQLKGRMGEMVEQMSMSCSSAFVRLLESQSTRLAGGSGSSRWQMAILFLVQHGVSNELNVDDGVLSAICSRVVQLLQQSAGTAGGGKLVEEALHALKSLCVAMNSQKAYGECFRVFAHFSTVQNDDSLQIRCRSMACFHQMASSNPSLFNTLMPSYLSLAAEIGGQRELRTWIETVIMMAGCGQVDAGTRMEYFKAVFVPLLAQIETACCRCMRDPRQFTQFTGLEWFISSGRSGNEPEQAKNNRLSLSNTMTLMQATAKGLKGKVVDVAVSNVIRDTFVPVCLNILDLLASAQSLVHGHFNYQRIFGELADPEDGVDDCESRLLRYFNGWWSHVRTVCYATLGYLAEHKHEHAGISGLLVGFDRIKCSDRTSLIRSALGPIFRLQGSADSLVQLLEFCRGDFAQPVYYSGDQKQAAEWLSAFTSFVCDVLLRKGCCCKSSVAVYSPITSTMITCIQNSAAPSVVSKWAGFLSDHIDGMVELDDPSLLRLLFADLTAAAIGHIAERSATHPQMITIIYELFRASSQHGLYEVDYLLTSGMAKIPGPEVDRLRAMLSSAQRSKAAKSLLSTLLQPLLRQARPDHRPGSVKKLVPDKLIILSKLRRAVEQEEVENRAVRDAADLFDH